MTQQQATGIKPLAADQGAAGKKFGVVVTADKAAAAAAAGDDLGKLYFPTDDTSAVYIGKQRYGLSEGAADYLQRKLAEENAAKVTVKVTVTPSGMQDRKDATTYNVRVDTLFNNKNVNPDKAPAGTDSAAAGVTFTKVDTGIYNATVEVAANATRAGFGVKATVQGVEKTANASFPRYYPVRFAAAAEAAPTLATATACSKAPLKTSAAGTYNYTSDAAYYMYLFVPDGVAAPSSTEATEGPLPVYFQKLDDLDVGAGSAEVGAGFKYKVYRSEQQQAAGTSHSITFK